MRGTHEIAEGCTEPGALEIRVALGYSGNRIRAGRWDRRRPRECRKLACYLRKGFRARRDCMLLLKGADENVHIGRWTCQGGRAPWPVSLHPVCLQSAHQRFKKEGLGRRQKSDGAPRHPGLARAPTGLPALARAGDPWCTDKSPVSRSQNSGSSCISPPASQFGPHSPGQSPPAFCQNRFPSIAGLVPG